MPINTLTKQEIKREYHRKWRQENAGRIKAYREARKDKQAEYEKRWRQENRERVAAKTRRYRERKRAEDEAAFHAANRAQNHSYRAANIEKVRAWKRAEHHRGMRDPEFVVVKRLRTRLHDEVRFRARKVRKITSVLNLIGCTRKQLVAHIEKQFLPGMSWSNRRLWHIDHIRPVASFDMMDLEQQRKCFHFTNLRPLWGTDNSSKGAKIQTLHT